MQRRGPAFRAVGPTWIVERRLAELGRNRRPGEHYECRVRTSGMLVIIAAIHLMLNRLAPGRLPAHPLEWLSGVPAYHYLGTTWADLCYL